MRPPARPSMPRQPSSTPRPATSPTRRATTVGSRCRSWTATRWWPTTSPTRPRRSRAPRVMLAYAEHGDLEARLAYAYIADAFADIVGRLVGREAQWGVDPADLASAHDFVAAHRDPAFLEALADELPRHGTGPAHLDDEFDMVRDTFHRFAEDKIRPVAEHIHRTNADIPDEIIDGHGRDRRLRALGARGVRRLRRRRRLRLPRDVRRDRGALVGLARRRRRAHHPARDPHPRHRQGRDRGAEARLAAADRVGRADRRRDGDRARLRLRRRRREGDRHRRRRRLRDQRREDVVHVRRPRRHADAARPHRSRPLARPPRPVGVRRREAARRGPPLRVRRRARGEDGGPRHRHPRLPRHALLRGRVRQLVRAGREPHRPRRRARQGLLPPDGGLRERPAPDRGTRRRAHAGRVRGRPRLRAGAQRLRQAGVRLPAVEGEAARRWPR